MPDPRPSADQRENCTSTLTIERAFHFERHGHGARKEVHGGEASPAPPARVPRIAKLMALAIRFEQLIRDGKVRDYADLARLGHVSRARLTQVMNLLLLPPDVQEAILFFEPVEHGRDPITLRQLQCITLQPNWTKQRRQWRNLIANHEKHKTASEATTDIA